jgi:hypothetical protein
MKSLLLAARFLILFAAVACDDFAIAAEPAPSPYAAWKHSGSMFILTTPDGANVPAGVVVREFPLLVRLHRDWFDFAAAKPEGADLRFAAKDGKPLAFEIDEWDPKAGEAAIWVRVPEIRGDERQELRVFWGNPAAESESDGAKVFNASNGYLSVWHMNGEPRDTVGTLESKDVGTTPSAGIVGRARHFAGKQGVFCGDKITGYPSGAAEHSTQLWYRAEQCNNTLIGWGDEPSGRGSKVRMLYRGPRVIRIDSNFSDVWTTQRQALAQWKHVTHTYSKDDGKLYIDGKLDGEAKPTLKIASPARLWLGGWYNNYDFVGDLDEVRVSSTARSADWVKLEYENQKQWQSLVSMVVLPGDELSITADGKVIEDGGVVERDEGDKIEFKAKAGGALKVRWSPEVVSHTLAADRFTFIPHTFPINEDATFPLRFQASYADGIRTRTVQLKVKDYPGPKFTLDVPKTWDGRTPLELTPKITNAEALRPSASGEIRYDWSTYGPAVAKKVAPGKLILERALGSGDLGVSVAVFNDRGMDHQVIKIKVAEPFKDSQQDRTPDADERPVDGQFYARDALGNGDIICNGKLTEAEAKPDGEPIARVFLKVYGGDELLLTHFKALGPDNTYKLSQGITAKLVKYRIEFGTVDKQGTERILYAAKDLMCGDAFLINGQSNAVATDFGKDAEAPPINEWVRTFGATEGGPTGSRLKLWAPAQARNRGGVSEIGYWGMELGRRLVEEHQVPICFINGAVGGTRIDMHQRNEADPTDVTTIYGRLLWRVREARLTHGIRAIIWHQGENDQGADGPSGDFGHERYRDYFHQLAASWQRDYPNVQQRYVFQIWPKSCSMGINGSDNVLRDVQRTLGSGISNLSVLSTLGIKPPGGCHYPAAGYAEFAKMLQPLIERDLYGKKFYAPITPPNLRRAYFPNKEKRDELVLEFDQPVVWDDKLAKQFTFDTKSGAVVGGRVDGNQLVLRLVEADDAATITYLDSKAWSQETLLLGTNGMAALTFYGVRIER